MCPSINSYFSILFYFGENASWLGREHFSIPWENHSVRVTSNIKQRLFEQQSVYFVQNRILYRIEKCSRMAGLKIYLASLMTKLVSWHGSYGTCLDCLG